MIDVAGLRSARDGRETCHLEARPDPLKHDGAVISFEEPVRLTVDVRRLDGFGGRSGVLMAQVHIGAQARLQCDRCLEPFDLSLELDYDEEFRPAGGAGAQGDGGAGNSDGDADEAGDDDGRDGSAVETRRSVYSGDVLDFSEGFMEAVILALPIKRLCREDCRGLCPRCGTNLNQGNCGCREERVDPRLAPLRQLLSKKEPEEGY